MRGCGPGHNRPSRPDLISTHLTTCPRFLALSAEEKMAAVLGNAACLHCAAWDHAVHRFPGGKPTKDPRCSVTVGGVQCGGGHGRWYHEEGRTGGAHSVVGAAPVQGTGLYEVYRSPILPPDSSFSSRQKTGMIMIDPGSDTNLICHAFALQLGLEAQPCKFRLKVVDREARPIQTARYCFEMEDRHGVRHAVTA